MTSPVGHSVGAYIANGGRYPVISVVSRDSIKHMILGLALLIFAANAPDLDFFWGAWLGDMNRYHHGPSHSIAAVFIFGALVWLLVSIFKWPKYLVATAALAYASHLVLDMVTADGVLPYGMQLFWPASEQYVLAPKSYFLNIDHGDMGASVFEAVPAIFTAHNVSAIAFELLVLGPPALFIYAYRRVRSGRVILDQ